MDRSSPFQKSSLYPGCYYILRKAEACPNGLRGKTQRSSSLQRKTLMLTISVKTSGQGLYEITQKVDAAMSARNAGSGVLTLFVQHTSASLIVQENADPSVQKDLVTFFNKIAPEIDHYAHSAEGPDDMPAHIKSALTTTSLSIPVIEGRLTLGTWQGIYLFEHRRAPHHRKIVGALAAAV